MQTVILVDDHQLIRAGINLLLQSIGGYQVVAEYSSGKSAIEGVLGLKPDLVLLDIAMPDMSGLDVLSTLKGHLGNGAQLVPQFVMLSMHSEPEYATRAMAAGASAYLLKNSAPEELEVALKAVTNGQQWLSAGIRIEQFASTDNQRIALSQRQREVLTLIANGLSTKEIAATLNLSPKTIETYRAQIMDKLSIRDIPSLVIYAVKVGLVSL